MSKLRIACIGAGSEPGSRTHAFMEVINQLTDLYDFVAVADRSSECAEYAADTYHIPGRFTDLEEMLRAEKPDVVVRLTPTDSAFATCIRAAEWGCHILNEIPIDLTLARADAIIDACRGNSVKLEVAENVWLWPQERLKRKIVEAGLLGELTHARLTYPCGHYHGFNAIRMILGADPERVLGYGGEVATFPRTSYGGEPMDSVKWDGGVVEFPGGLRCLFEMPPKKLVWQRKWDIEGTRGYLSGDDLVLYEDGEEQRYPIEWVTGERDGESVLEAVRVNTDPPVVWENPYARYGISEMDNIAKAALLESIHRAAVEDVEPIYGAANARRDQEIAIALQASAWRGNQWVELPLTEETEVEKRLHEEFERRYGCDPLGDVDAQLRASYSRASVMWTICGWL